MRHRVLTGDIGGTNARFALVDVDQAMAGCVYVTGGIAPRIVERLRSGGFMDAFRAKGRLSEVVERMPVRVVLTSDIALYGAAAVAARTLLD